MKGIIMNPLQTTMSLIYVANDPDAQKLAERAAAYLQEACAVRVCPVPDTGRTGGAEICLGEVDRETVRNLAAGLSETTDFLAGVYGDRYVILSADRFGLAVGLKHFADTVLRCGTVPVSENRRGRLADLPRDAFYRDAVLLARRLFDTYGSWLEKQKPTMSDADLEDIRLVDVLIRHLGNAVVFRAGKTVALWNGRVTKLDPSDYTACATVDGNGHLHIPSCFAAVLLGFSADGTCDLTVFCQGDSAWELTRHGDLYFLSPVGGVSFAGDVETEGFDNAQCLARLAHFFDNPVLPEPHNRAEQTRREVIRNQFGTVWHSDYTKVTYDNYYSPAICGGTEAEPAGTVYLSHEISRLRNHTELATETQLKVSHDGCKTWRTVADVPDLRWASLFEYGGRIWLMGNCSSNGNCMVAVYDPAQNRFAWSDLGFSMMGSAPCAVAFANGRIYRAHNGGVISAPLESDWLDGKSWTRSNDPNRLVTRAEYERLTGMKTDPEKRFWFEEGNIVLGRDGALYAIYRIDATPTWGYAAIFRLSEDGRTLSAIDSCGSIIPFPSNQSKFVIRYDEKTDRYYSLTSLPTGDYTHQRNVLGLVESSDLFNWSVVDTVLVERQMMNDRLSIYAHAFQYADFLIDADGILMVIRESAGDTCCYHDGNCVTLYRLTRSEF